MNLRCGRQRGVDLGEFLNRGQEVDDVVCRNQELDQCRRAVCRTFSFGDVIEFLRFFMNRRHTHTLEMKNQKCFVCLMK